MLEVQLCGFPYTDVILLYRHKFNMKNRILMNIKYLWIQYVNLYMWIWTYSIHVFQTHIELICRKRYEIVVEKTRVNRRVQICCFINIDYIWVLYSMNDITINPYKIRVNVARTTSIHSWINIHTTTSTRNQQVHI